MIFSKKNTRFSIMGMLAAFFTAACLLTGCGDSSEDAKNAKNDEGDIQYLLYKKEGDAKQGYFIHVIGLNTECDQGGTLIVNLDDIINKNNGKITIPAQIDGLPVKKVSLSPEKQNQLLGGVVADTGSLSLRTITGSDGMKFYLDDTSKYYNYVSEVVLPDGVEEVNLNGFALKGDLKVPASTTKFESRHITGKLVIPLKAYMGSFAPETSADHLEVFATDKAPVEREVQVKATKSAKFPENVKKLDVSPLFYGSTSGWDKQYRIRPESKGFKLTCAPDVTFIKNDYARTEITRNLWSGHVYVNDKDLTDYLKTK